MRPLILIRAMRADDELAAEELPTFGSDGLDRGRRVGKNDVDSEK